MNFQKCPICCAFAFDFKRTVDFKNLDKNLQNLASQRDAAGF